MCAHTHSDVNGDGFVTLDEFVLAVQRKSIQLAEEELGGWKALFAYLEESDPAYLERGDTTLSRAATKLFHTADTDGGGTIDLKELASSMQRLGLRLEPRQLVSFRDSIDENGDGETLSF